MWKRGFTSLAWFLVLAACTQEIDETRLSTAAVRHTSSDVLWFEDGTKVDGASATLTTHPNGGTLRLHTQGLAPGNTHTLWWIIFNYPAECSAPGCGEDDIFVDGDPAQGPDLGQINATAASVVFGAGHVIGGKGTARFATHLRAGDVSGTREVVLGPSDGPAGLLEPMTAEVHTVVRDHGPPIPGYVDEQIGTFGGGCTPETGGDLTDGNACMEPQFAVLIQ